MWFFRVVELDAGSWACRRGLTCIDEHGAFAAAFEHMCALAASEPPSQVVVHSRDSLPVVAACFETG